MGFSISWVGFKGLSKAEVLQRARLRDTGIVDEANEAPFSCAELPTGWTVLFSNDFDYGALEHLCALSVGVMALSCQVEEHVMYSATYCCIDGRELWAASHNSEKGIYNLSTSGPLPNKFLLIRTRLTGQQDDSGGAKSGVDFVFDIPVELAAALTGYRHDRWKFDWGQPKFIAAERTAQ